MKSALAIATISIFCAAGHAFASAVNIPMTRRHPGFALTMVAGQNTVSGLNGRWQGTTVSGQKLVLELQVQGERLTGKLTVGKQSAKVNYGKVVGDAFALTTGPIDGRDVDGSGRQVGDALELTIEGVKEPLTLTRMK